jgi:hypothetical protein
MKVDTDSLRRTLNQNKLEDIASKVIQVQTTPHGDGNETTTILYDDGSVYGGHYVLIKGQSRATPNNEKKYEMKWTKLNLPK